MPEWVLVDIGLPGIDGFALAGLIRGHRNGKDARIYALTGYGRFEDRTLADASGFDGHFTKPVDPSVLLRSWIGRAAGTTLSGQHRNAALDPHRYGAALRIRSLYSGLGV